MRPERQNRSKCAICIVAGLMFFFAAGPFAGEIYTWTDKDGMLHMTDTPPSKSAETVDVMRYAPRSSKEQKAVRQTQNDEKFDEQLKVAEAQVERARKRAVEARQKADAAEKVAREQRAKTGQMEQAATKRKRDQLELSRQKALEAQTAEQALEARQQARDAEKLVQQAETRLDSLKKTNQQVRRQK